MHDMFTKISRSYTSQTIGYRFPNKATSTFVQPIKISKKPQTISVADVPLSGALQIQALHSYSRGQEWKSENNSMI